MDDLKTKPESYWRDRLTDMQFRVCRQKGTERPFTGEYCDAKGVGEYHCVCCDRPLFRSTEKYDSGSGWPSFWEVIDLKALELHSDRELGFQERIEVRCSSCSAHLGHLFDDGPQPTGKRYCINSAALKFVAASTPPVSKR